VPGDLHADGLRDTGLQETTAGRAPEIMGEKIPKTDTRGCFQRWLQLPHVQSETHAFRKVQFMDCCPHAGHTIVSAGGAVFAGLRCALVGVVGTALPVSDRWYR